MEDASVKIDTVTRDRLKALAAARGMTMRYVAELAEKAEHDQRLETATAVFQRVINEPGIAARFDEDFGGLPQAQQHH